MFADVECMFAYDCLCLLMFHMCICLGLSEYFPNVQNLRNAKMKNGGLEAQRVPDLLFWLVFAIGTEGAVVPNKNTSYSVEGVIKLFNPTSVILSSLVACLELLWYCRCPTMSVTDILDTLPRVCKVADAYYTRLLGLSYFLLGDKNLDNTVKRHIWKDHMPDFFFRVGANVFNDTDLPEHGHIEDKALFQRTSKRYKTNLEELANQVLYVWLYLLMLCHDCLIF